MLLFSRVRPRRVQVPLLVLGAEHDPIFNVAQVVNTARVYHTEAEIFPGLGHDMMLDRGWERVADRVDAWASTLPRAPERRPGA